MFPVYTQTFHARRWPVLIVFAILVLPFLILKLQGDQSKGLDVFILIGVIFCGLLHIWAKNMSITIDNEGITYKVIFKQRTIAWKDIRATHLGFEFHGKGGDFVWSFISLDNKQINISTG